MLPEAPTQARSKIQKGPNMIITTSTADVHGRWAPRSAGTNQLVVSPVTLFTVGSRTFPVAAAQIWNSLPEHIVSAPTLQSFRRHLKTFLLQQSFCL